MAWTSLLLLSLCCCLCSIGTQAAGAAGTRVLVLTQDGKDIKNEHSKYFKALQDAGFSLDFKGHRDASLKLRDYDTWLYDHLAIFSPTAESFGGSINQQTILDFIDSGHNVILAASGKATDLIRNLAAEVGVDLDDKGTQVYDHLNHALDSAGQPDHNLVIATDTLSSTAIFGADIKAPILFQGVAATVPSDAELVTVALSAPATSYSHDPRKAMLDPPVAGPGIALMALVQARNNARVLVCGSTSLFSDKFFDAEVTVAATGKKLGKSGNEAMAVGASLWALQARGVLRSSQLRHRLLRDPPGTPQPRGYRVNDEVEVAVDILQYTKGQPQPYDAEDVQVEFVMLDPYVRLPLKHAGNGTYSLQFKVPDVYGVFKYRLSYRHQGYSYIELTQQVPVRPYKHNEYERFLVCAYPYYASALSGMLAFFVLGFFFLYHKS